MLEEINVFKHIETVASFIGIFVFLCHFITIGDKQMESEKSITGVFRARKIALCLTTH